MQERPVAVFTYQTRLDTVSAHDALTAYARLHGRVQRSLFAALRAGQPLNALKREFQRRFGVTARQFNAARVELEGKIASIKARQPELIAEAKTRLRKAEKVIAKLEKQAAGSNKLHQKKRRLAMLKARLTAMETDVVEGKIRLCFGSRKLFRAQFALAANGYKDLDQWRQDWRSARASQFFVLGSQDESAGNQTCQARLEEDGSLSLTLRLPDALAEYGKHLTLRGVRFAYGHEQIIAALQTSRRIESVTKAGTPTKKLVGTALSYRFVRDDKGWRVFATVEAAPVAQRSHRLAGAVGVDINADHLAVSETDRFGNLVTARRVPLVVYGKTSDQAKALIGDAAVAIATQAKAAGKPVVIEKLNFQKKKAELETVDPAQARRISSFACNKTITGLKAACFRAGIEVIEINPAYTSIIGAVNHAQLKGVSVHMGAALAIARRGLGLSEKPILRTAVVPVRHGGHVTFELPVRNRSKHGWSHWSAIRTRLRAAHVAHYRSGQSKENPAPLPPETRVLGANWYSTAKLRGANRQQHCSAGVFEDVPY